MLQPLAYKELDGAVAGSRELITYDYISDQPDIPVETWGSESLLEEYCGVSQEPTAITLDPNHANYYTGHNMGVATQDMDAATQNGMIIEWPTEGDVLQGEGEATGSEVQKYLETQEAFSYDYAAGGYVMEDNVNLGSIGKAAIGTSEPGLLEERDRQELQHQWEWAAYDEQGIGNSEDRRVGAGALYKEGEEAGCIFDGSATTAAADVEEAAATGWGTGANAEELDGLVTAKDSEYVPATLSYGMDAI